MKSKLEKIEALLLRSQNPAALHEVQQLIEDCGDLAAKDSLLKYLKLQRRKLNSHYKTRLKIVPSMDKEPWLSKIKKWDDWIDFVLSASQPKGDM